MEDDFMSLVGKNTEEKIWNFFKSKGYTDFAIAGIMGNMYAESGLSPINVQNNGNANLGMTDAEFTKAVDSGKYSRDRFIKDSYGYGLVQLTWWTLKRDYYDYAKKAKKSIGDLETQLKFIHKLFTENYKTMCNTLMKAKSVLAASNAVLLQFERPADQSVSMQKRRASFGEVYYKKYRVVKYALKKNCGIYPKKYKDLVGGASKPIITLTKGKTITLIKDLKNGWSKVSHGEKVGYMMNANIGAKSLSTFKTQITTSKIDAYLIENNKVSKTVSIKKGAKVIVLCKINTGKYKGYSYFKYNDKKYYGII
jgi:hypothetical protein